MWAGVKLNEHAVISPLSPPVLPSSRTHTHVPRPLALDDNDDDDSFPGGRTSIRHTFIMPEHHTRAGEVRNKLAESLMTFLGCCLPPLRTESRTRTDATLKYLNSKEMICAQQIDTAMMAVP